MTLSDFCASYLKSQGVLILPPTRELTRAVTGKQEREYVPVTLQYGRD